MYLLGSIVLHFTFWMLSLSMPGIPYNAVPPPGTTKNILAPSFGILLDIMPLRTQRNIIFTSSILSALSSSDVLPALTAISLYFMHKSALLHLCSGQFYGTSQYTCEVVFFPQLPHIFLYAGHFLQGW